MDWMEKLGDTISAKGREAADKAKEMAQIASLKSQISTCEEVIKKNYMEIGRLYYEKYGAVDTPVAEEGQEAPFVKQCRAIRNARNGVNELQEKIRELKGL